MNLKKACIDRYGVDEGIDVFNALIDECFEALDTGNCLEIEELIYQAGFAVDYVEDMINILSAT